MAIKAYSAGKVEEHFRPTGNCVVGPEQFRVFIPDKTVRLVVAYALNLDFEEARLQALHYRLQQGDPYLLFVTDKLQLGKTANYAVVGGRKAFAFDRQDMAEFVAALLSGDEMRIDKTWEAALESCSPWSTRASRFKTTTRYSMGLMPPPGTVFGDMGV